jgi:hypothetical protein
MMACEERSNDAANDPAPTPEILIASVLHLMSHYLASIDNAATRANLALAIERHFQTLSILPDLAPILRGTCSQLSEQWGPLVASNSARIEQRCARLSILDRFRRFAS